MKCHLLIVFFTLIVFSTTSTKSDAGIPNNRTIRSDLTPAQLVREDQIALRSGAIDRVTYMYISIGDGPTGSDISARAESALNKASYFASVRSKNGKQTETVTAKISSQNYSTAEVTTSSYILCDPCKIFEPSILSGRAAQYTIGPRYYTTGPLLFCWSNGQYYPSTVKINWKIRPGFGGHEALAHSGISPPGRMEWTGQNIVKKGAYAPALGILANPNIDIYTTAQDQLDFDTGKKQLKWIFPEAANDLVLQITSAVCNIDGFPSEDMIPTEYSGFDYVYRLKARVDLSYLPTFSSSDGNSNLLFERSINSHRYDAGHGSPETSTTLQNFTQIYRDCIGETSQTLISTAVSIIHGGLYDIYKNWKPSHRNHRAGEDTDIALNNFGQPQLDCIYTATTLSGLSMPVSDESLVLSYGGNVEYGPGMDVEHPHIHLWNGVTHFYPLDVTDQGW